MDFSKYSKRLNLKGENATDALMNTSEYFFYSQFESSASYYKVLVDGVDMGVIINKTKNYDEKKIHFKNYTPSMGSIVTSESKDYLMIEVDGDKIYHFGLMKECNTTIPLEIDSEEIFVGYDDRGAPLYKNKVKYHEQPSVVTSKYYSEAENAQLPLPEGKLLMMTTYNPKFKIEVNDELIVHNKRYTVADFGYTKVINGTGILEINLERRVGRNQ